MKFRIQITDDGAIRVNPIGPPGVTLETLKELDVSGEPDRATFHANGVSGDWYAGCYREYGPRGGVSSRSELWRANGMLKLWKTRPTEFRLPLKFGLRSFGELTHRNAVYFHHAGDCPCEKLPNDREGLVALLAERGLSDPLASPSTSILDFNPQPSTGGEGRDEARTRPGECPECRAEVAPADIGKLCWDCAAKEAQHG